MQKTKNADLLFGTIVGIEVVLSHGDARGGRLGLLRLLVEHHHLHIKHATHHMNRREHAEVAVEKEAAAEAFWPRNGTFTRT